MELARIYKKNISSRTAAERELMSNDESDDDAFRFQLAAVNVISSFDNLPTATC